MFEITSARASPFLKTMDQSHYSKVVRWARRNLFSGVFNSSITIALLFVALYAVPNFIDWALLRSVWVATDPAQCSGPVGACWAVVTEKSRIILFGVYPYEEQWRGIAVIALVLGLGITASFRRLWSMQLVVLLLVGVATALVLQTGGVFGLSYVNTDKWGGLPLTLLLFIGTVSLGTPLGIALALGRRSQLPILNKLCTAYIEIVRGIPLVNILFMAALLFPLFMPAGFNLDKLLRAQFGLALFYAAYCAEVVRGGLQAIPRGQYEAADVLGLTYWQSTFRIMLPQALRIAMGPLVNEIIRAFKNTSVLTVIGLFDLLGGAMTALSDPLWAPYHVETYLFVFALYFCFCWPMSKYSQQFESDKTQQRGKQ